MKQKELEDKLYHYKVFLSEDCYDADTIYLDIDLGFGITIGGIHIKKTDKKYRINRVDAFEIRSKDKDQKKKAYEGRDFVREILKDKELIARTYKKGKYGRMVIELFYLVEGMYFNLSDVLVEKGYAVYKTY